VLAAIQAKNITKTVLDSAGSIDILKDISLSVAAGSSLAILGAAGNQRS
jgi:predicted ABC-type transport system involved in lysophospholipase L1 biosynthesis ATPase subunit